jgi:hypothetical protein
MATMALGMGLVKQLWPFFLSLKHIELKLFSMICGWNLYRL